MCKSAEILYVRLLVFVTYKKTIKLISDARSKWNSEETFITFVRSLFFEFRWYVIDIIRRATIAIGMQPPAVDINTETFANAFKTKIKWGKKIL